MAALGATLNFGTDDEHVPPRPWLVPGVESATQDILDTIADGLEKGTPSVQVLEQVGVIAVGKVKEFMTDLSSPANATSTIKAKGSSNPLIDTGALRASVDYKITNEKPEEGI